MTPADSNDFAEDDSEKLGETFPSTASVQQRWTRRTGRRRTLLFALRHPVPGRPSTVWPCAQDDLCDGTGLLASWLLTAVVKIVTTYTRPGQRVLLLEPAAYTAPCGPHTVNDSRGQSLPSPYAGLHEAGWTVFRLGRGVQTQTAVVHPVQAGEPFRAESGGGLRESSDSPNANELAGPSVPKDSGPDSVRIAPGPDCYDLVIVAAQPGILGGFRSFDWRRVLTPSGILAVITHGDWSGHRFTDPASSLIRVADSAGLRYLDRIVLLRAPVFDGAIVVASPTKSAGSHTSVRPLTAPVQHVQVHDDLVVFTRNRATDGEVSSDA